METSAPAFDRIVRMQPTQIANFILSSEVVRAAVASAGETLILLPERGSLPLYWAADGAAGFEESISANGVLHLPIGTYEFQDDAGVQKQGTLDFSQKQRVIAEHHRLLADTSRTLIIDEVQKGGTITELVNIVRKQRGDQPKRLYVVAAQDSRRKVSNEAKKPAYQALASNTVDGVSTTVVPIPLVTTDVDAVLNKLWYPGKTRVPTEDHPKIEIRPNREAELIFRLFGMAARTREALEDTSLLDSLVFSLPVGPKASQRLEQWREAFITRLKTRSSS